MLTWPRVQDSPLVWIELCAVTEIHHSYSSNSSSVWDCFLLLPHLWRVLNMVWDTQRLVRWFFQAPISCCPWCVEWASVCWLCVGVPNSYEAVVIYTFLHLCLAYVGGPGAVETDMKDSELSPSCLSMTCCLPHVKIDGRFVKWCKNGTLQFVLVKPILAAVTLLLYANNLYTEGNWNINNGWAFEIFQSSLRLFKTTTLMHYVKDGLFLDSVLTIKPVTQWARGVT